MRGHWTRMERFISAHNSDLGWARKGSSFSQAQPETLTTHELKIQHMQQCSLGVVLNRDKFIHLCQIQGAGSTAPAWSRTRAGDRRWIFLMAQAAQIKQSPNPADSPSRLLVHHRAWVIWIKEKSRKKRFQTAPCYVFGE